MAKTVKERSDYRCTSLTTKEKATLKFLNPDDLLLQKFSSVLYLLAELSHYPPAEFNHSIKQTNNHALSSIHRDVLKIIQEILNTM